MSEREPAAPTGEVTFLFTDIEGSTPWWERDPDAMERALVEHDDRLRDVIAEHDGYIFTTAGDSFAVAFGSAHEALAAAIAMQQRLTEPCAGLPLRVRIGLHTGSATARDGDYFGAVVNRCARLMASAHGGQILLSGPTADLVRTSPGVDLIDCGEHRLKDLLRSMHIFQVRHHDLQDRFPPLRTLEGPQSNLPTQLTSFVGRDVELAAVGEMLADHRLVTLTGSGGAGKTRLAMQVAADAVEFFPDGVRLVELGALSDPDHVLDEIAAVVDTSAVPATPLIDTIIDAIGVQRLLLVLDNCEHMVDTVVALVRALLRGCPNLKILATSQERLNSAGELAYRVPSLAMPAATELKAVRDADAVRLFTDRATLAKPDFAVDADNVEAVLSICRRLDGIPLALELAAARLRVLSPAQVAQRLDERFTLLAGASRDVLERHRTLAATIDWSYEHLTPSERAVFRRASVFAANFNIDAAESVCALDDIDEWAVLDLITGLVDKSMLVPEESDDGYVRYRMLETMRDYGRMRLLDEGEGAAVHDAHADFFVGYTEQLQQVQRAGSVAEALGGYERDEDNVRAALRHTLDNAREVDAARIIGAVGFIWYASGAFREGIEWCDDLFEREPDLPDEVLAGALHAKAMLVGSWSQPDVGAELLVREVELRRRIGDPVRLAAALNNLGNVQNDLGDFARAEVTLGEAVEQYRAAGEPATIALASLGFGHKDAGHYDVARPMFDEALAEATAAGNSYGIALAISGTGECAVHQGRVSEARPLLREARDRFESLRVVPGVAYIDVLLALSDLAEGTDDDAAHRLVAALAAPDAHWYATTKYWILQLAAGIIADRTVAAELFGVVEPAYAVAGRPQPTWVTDHLASLRTALEDALGADTFDRYRDLGRRITAGEAIDLAIRHLGELVESQ